MTPPYRAAFTLLEICLALAIGVLIIVLTVPSIVGLLAEQRLRESYTRLDELVAAAKAASVTGQRECRLVWDKKGITLRRGTRAGATEGAPPEEDVRLLFQSGEEFRLRRTAALQKSAPDEWAFWRNGTCEPAQIEFDGPPGSWTVNYDPLTGHGTFVQSNLR